MLNSNIIFFSSAVQNLRVEEQRGAPVFSSSLLPVAIGDSS